MHSNLKIFIFAQTFEIYRFVILRLIWDAKVTD